MTGRARALSGVLRHGDVVRRPRVSRRQMAVGILVLVGLVALTAWLLLRSGSFAVRVIDVAGAADVPPADIVAAAEVPPGTPLLTVDTEAVARRVETLPAVRRADVVRRWPRTVAISVEERRPAAVRRHGRSYVIIDKSGVAFDTARKRPRGLSLVTVPSQVDATGRTPTPDPGAVRAALTVLGQLPPAVREQVVEVRAPARDRVTLRLTRGRIVIWGAPDRGPRKAEVLAALVTRKARVYDISAPDTPTTRK